MFPIVRAYGTNNPSATNTTFTLPTPTGVQIGDLMIANVVFDGNIATGWPSGWTEFGNFQPSANLGMYWGYGRYSTSMAFSGLTTGGFAVHCGMNVFAIYNSRGVPEASAAGSSASAPNPPSETQSWGAEDTLWLAMACYRDGTQVISTYPTNYTLYQHNDRNNANPGPGLLSAGRELNAATDDPGAFTLAVSAGRGYAAVTAIRGLARVPRTAMNHQDPTF